MRASIGNLSLWNCRIQGTLLLATGLALMLAGCKDKTDAGSGTTANGGSDSGKSGTATNSGGSSGGASGDEIVVGEYGSFTGKQSDFGIQTDNGIQLAVAETNEAGGVDVGGKKMKIKLVTEDDQSDSTKADTAVKRLIDEKSVTAVLGEVASSNSQAGGKVCQERGVPMISPSSTNESVTKDRDEVFRVCFIDSYQAGVVARYIIDGLKVKNVATFTNKSESYSTGFTNEFKKKFVQYGGKIIMEQTYGTNDQDYRGQLTAIKSVNPDAILVPGYYSDAGSIAKQARELGIKVPLLGGDGWSSPELLKIGGTAVEGCYFSDHMSIKDPKPVVQNFVKGYKGKFNTEPTSMSALGYDAAKILFDAISRAKSTDKKAIRDAIAQTKDYEGLTGKITIDENRNARKPAVINVVKNGSFDYAATIPDPDQPMPGK